jgi:hypothetical protein
MRDYAFQHRFLRLPGGPLSAPELPMLKSLLRRPETQPVVTEQAQKKVFALRSLLWGFSATSGKDTLPFFSSPTVPAKRWGHGHFVAGGCQSLTGSSMINRVPRG